jgi:hypothetical protein
VNAQLCRTYITKSFTARPSRALVLNDGSGVVVVEPRRNGGSNSLVIFNSDGSERFRMGVPDEGRAFHDVYYVGEELTAIVAFLTVDFAYVLDSTTGEVVRSYEIR